jgi:uncharacterized delta-60 repeat protein
MLAKNWLRSLTTKLHGPRLLRAARRATGRLRLEALEDRVVPVSRFAEFCVPTASSIPNVIAAGPDGNVWVTEYGVTAGGQGQIAKINPTTGCITQYQVPLARARSIVGGPDGNIWFTEGTSDGAPTGSKIGVFSPITETVIREYPLRSGSDPALTVGPDGNIWFTEYWNHFIGRISTNPLPPDGELAQDFIVNSVLGANNIAPGPDGNLWFTSSYGGTKYLGKLSTQGANLGQFDLTGHILRGLAAADGNMWTCDPTLSRILKISTSGQLLAMYSTPTPNAGPYHIVAGLHGDLWFTEPNVHKIARITTNGSITEFATPTHNSGVHILTIGPDNNLWFVEPDANKIGRFSLANQNPVIDVVTRDMTGNLATAQEGTPFRLDASGTTDPDGVEDQTRLTYRWDFGDIVQFGSQVNWSYPEDGSYSVTLTVTDPLGGVTTTCVHITVNNAPPVVDLLRGAVDTGFGTNGVVSTPTSDIVVSASQLRDGRIVALIQDGTNPIAPVMGFRRFLTDGNPDSSFDNDGRLETSFTYVFAAYALQGDKIIVASQSGSSVALQRFNADGSSDEVFAGGVVSTNIPGAVVVTVLANNQIRVVGGTVTGMALVFCTENGALDYSFGPNNNAAEVLTPTPHNRENDVPFRSPAALVVQPDGKILVGDSDFAVLRFNGNGTLDTNFGAYVSGNAGPRTGCADQATFSDVTVAGDPLSAIALDPRAGGRIVALGNYGIVRYTNDGQLDSGFWGDGVVEYAGALYRTDHGYINLSNQKAQYGSNLGLGLPTYFPIPAGFVIQSDGAILIAGSVANVGRLTAPGYPDVSFGTGQGVILHVATDGYMTEMLAQAGGRLTLVGNTAGSIKLVRFTTLPAASYVFAGQQYSLGLRATDPAPNDQADGFEFQVDWGDGMPVETISRTSGNGAGISPNHVYATVGASTIYTIQVVAIDKDNGQSQPFSFDVTVAPFTTEDIANVLAGSLPTDPISGLPAAIFAVSTVAEANSIVDAIEDQNNPVAVVLNAPGVDFQGANFTVPAGVTLVIYGANWHPSSPALTLNSGNLIITNSTFVNATNAPTILVNGGRLTLRNNVIQESIGYDQVAIRVTGGFVDLGTANDPGGNTININGPGSFFLNATSTPISVVGNDFAVNGQPYVIAASSVQGLVWLDANNNSEVDFGEEAIAGTTITLHGTDDLGNVVHRVAHSDAQGIYVFSELRPSNVAGYTITETQPAGYLDGRESRGTVNGVLTGSTTFNDTFAEIVLPTGSLAEDYNFGERATGGGSGQTATIGFWQNKKGQDLIKALNGGPTATQLGHWLAVTFPNMYVSLEGLTNSGVASFYKALFARNANSSPGGPAKVDAQVMATALAVYVTNQTLAGNTATAYGFQVTADGVGARTFNVGSRGAAFGVANNSFVSVMDLLLAVNARSHNGLLYDMNGDGQISSSEASLRTMANDLFSAINESGGI